MTGGADRCARCSSTVEPDDLRCPVCNLTCAGTRADGPDGLTVDILRCTGCGAAMTYTVEEGSSACAFCGSVLELEHPTDPIEEADTLLPFTVDADRAKTALRQWLDSLGWFRPGDLRSESRVEEIRPLGWIGWVFDASAEVSWAADTDAGARRSDWAPHAGQTDLEYDDVIVPATRGLSPDEVARLLPSYDLSSAGGADEVDASAVERFDVPRSTARRRLVEAVERLARRRLEERHLPGQRSRNLSTATVLRSLKARRVAFPAWVLAYRYKDRLYRTVLSGQDATCIEGSAPYSIAKIAAVIGGGLGLIALLTALAVVL